VPWVRIPFFLFEATENLNMMFNNLVFLFFSSSLIISSSIIILINNPVYAILFTILSFVSAVGLLVLLESEFMALIFVVIYIGAIAVLFLFVVMMLNIKIINPTKDIFKYFPISNFIGVFLLAEIFYSTFNNFQKNSYSDSLLTNMYTNWFDKLDSIIDINMLGQIIYTHYVVQFLIAGFVLIIAILGATTMTLGHHSVNFKKQDTFKQVSR
jgi:NADH-quinone oxidoreductase subunit J